MFKKMFSLFFFTVLLPHCTHGIIKNINVVCNAVVQHKKKTRDVFNPCITHTFRPHSHSGADKRA